MASRVRTYLANAASERAPFDSSARAVRTDEATDYVELLQTADRAAILATRDPRDALQARS